MSRNATARRRRRRGAVAAALTVTAALGLGACGVFEGDAPEPVASIDAVTNLNVDPGVSRVHGDVSVNGKQAASSAFIFQLDGRTLKPLKSAARTATLEGTEVKVSPVAAQLLNATFKTKAVEPGLLVGVAKITVDTKSGA